MTLNARASMFTVLILVCLGSSQSDRSGPGSVLRPSPTPLLLEKSEGERRLWRDPPPGGFLLKVSPENNGSQHLVLGTEDLLPGDIIPRHKHLGQDEIVLVQSGVAHVEVGDHERDLRAGGMAFIPADTWVNLKNRGVEPSSIVFIFSAPGFENHLRCVSVPAHEKPTPMTPEERTQCDHKGHVIYSGLDENAGK